VLRLSVKIRSLALENIWNNRWNIV
jgi:hypothetical protein